MESEHNRQPWDKQPNESPQAYRAFRHFLNIPSHERSVERVSSELGKQASGLYRWKGKWDWIDRAEAWDRYQERLSLDEELRQREEMRQHTLKIGQALRRKGVEAINHIDPSTLSVSQTLNLLLEGEKMMTRATGDTEELEQRRDMEYAADEETARDRSAEITEAARVYQDLIDQGVLLPPTS